MISHKFKPLEAFFPPEVFHSEFGPPENFSRDPKGNIISQSSFFRGELLNFGGVEFFWLSEPTFQQKEAQSPRKKTICPTHNCRFGWGYVAISRVSMAPKDRLVMVWLFYTEDETLPIKNNTVDGRYPKQPPGMYKTL